MPGYVVDVLLLSTHLPHPSLFIFYATVDRVPEDLADPAYRQLFRGNQNAVSGSGTT